MTNVLISSFPVFAVVLELQHPAMIRHIFTVQPLLYSSITPTDETLLLSRLHLYTLVRSLARQTDK